MERKHYPSDLTDVQWEIIQPLLPEQAKRGRKPTDRREIINGILYVNCTGCQQRALPLFAMLRDYSLATLDAAKAAAYFAGILYTDAPPGGEAESVEPLDEIELDRNLLLTMPGGWKMSQLEAEQPVIANLPRFQVGSGVAKAVTPELAGLAGQRDYGFERPDNVAVMKDVRKTRK